MAAKRLGADSEDFLQPFRSGHPMASGHTTSRRDQPLTSVDCGHHADLVSRFLERGEFKLKISLNAKRGEHSELSNGESIFLSSQDANAQR